MDFLFLLQKCSFWWEKLIPKTEFLSDQNWGSSFFVCQWYWPLAIYGMFDGLVTPLKWEFLLNISNVETSKHLQLCKDEGFQHLYLTPSNEFKELRVIFLSMHSYQMANILAVVFYPFQWMMSEAEWVSWAKTSESLMRGPTVFKMTALRGTSSVSSMQWLSMSTSAMAGASLELRPSTLPHQAWQLHRRATKWSIWEASAADGLAGGAVLFLNLVIGSLVLYCTIIITGCSVTHHSHFFLIFFFEFFSIYWDFGVKKNTVLWN